MCPTLHRKRSIRIVVVRARLVAYPAARATAKRAKHRVLASRVVAAVPAVRARPAVVPQRPPPASARNIAMSVRAKAHIILVLHHVHVHTQLSPIRVARRSRRASTVAAASIVTGISCSVEVPDQKGPMNTGPLVMYACTGLFSCFCFYFLTSR